jgi:hypothetical protein
VGLKLSGTHQLLAYADDVNIQGHNIGSIKRNTETLIDASKKVGLAVNVEWRSKSGHKNCKQIIQKCVTV